MAKHKRNRNYRVTRQRATARAEKEHAMPKCTRCGGVGGHHAAGCWGLPRPTGGLVVVDDELTRLRAENAAALRLAEARYQIVKRLHGILVEIRAAGGLGSLPAIGREIAGNVIDDIGFFLRWRVDDQPAPRTQVSEELLAHEIRLRPTLTPTEFERLYRGEWPSEQPPAAEQGGGAVDEYNAAEGAAWGPGIMEQGGEGGGE